MSNETDQTLNCRDCQQPFVFTEGEQKFYAEKQLHNPTRCKPCRQAKKAAKEASESGGTFNPSGGFSSGGYQQSAGPVDEDGPRRGGGGRRGRNDHGPY